MLGLNYEYIKDPLHIPRIREWITSCSNPLQVDTETTGLDPHKNKVLLYQFGMKGKQFVIDNRFVPIAAFKDILESNGKLKVLHNAKFDYKMLKSEGITMECMRDTFLAEHCLTAGLQEAGRGLGDLALKYFNVKLDKEMQETFENLPLDTVFSERQIAYAAADVVLLENMLRKQWVNIEKFGLQSTAMLEFKVIPAFADMEYYGICIDKSQWLSNIDGSKRSLLQVLSGLNNWAVNNRYTSYDLNGLTDINWNSQKQVLTILQKLYPKLTSTNDEVLEDYWCKYAHPIIKAIREFRDLSKQTGTYGASYLSHINDRTGRIHPEFNQYGTATGRPSGKKPNMLNIPRDKKYRESFIAPEGFDIHTKDYSGCELRIVASMSGDAAMCDAYNKGMDLHTYVAAKFMRKDYDTLVALIKAKNEEACQIRQACKSLNFGVVYGMGPARLAGNLKINLDLARTYYYGHKKEFATMHKFLEATGKAAIENGYSTTALGRKRFFNKPAYPENILRAYNQSKSTLSMSLYEYAESRIPKYFDYKQNAKAEFVEPMIFAEWKECGPGITPEIRTFMAQASAIGREAANHPIQGGNADVTKHAMVKVRNMFKSKGYYPHAHIMLQVYDELAVVAPTKWREEVNNIIDSAMIEAGEMIITKLPVTIDGHVKGCWTK